MIKKTLLGLGVVAMAFSSFAQLTHETPRFPKTGSPVEVDFIKNDPSVAKFAKKGGLQGSGWYNYFRSLGQGGETFVYFGDAALWPDSLPVIVYPSPTDQAHAWWFGAGQCFDPTSEWFQDADAPQLTGFNRYSIDSVAFRYKYRHAVPGSVDTLTIDFFNDDKLVPLVFTSGDRAYAPVYIKGINRSNAVSSTVQILLDDTYDTESFFFPTSNSYSKNMEIALPSVMNVKEGGKMAFTINYKPGVSYAYGDTLITGRDSVNVPVKQTNTFQPYYIQAETGIPDNSHNYALTVMDNQRYGTRSPEWYYPNSGYTKIRHLDAWFKLTYYNLSAKDINNSGYGLGSVYPNPVKAGQDVKIEFALGKGELVNIQLFNVLGSKVADVASGKYSAGENSVVFNTSKLTPGVYLYTLSAGSFKASKKITIVD
ncbi:MAG: T9SS type A sorting domain-containing protein [Flavobacteriales bacterium]|nr:T9SS type A sorting domain-containing protein [Flavobacteriales bacterium]